MKTSVPSKIETNTNINGYFIAASYHANHLYKPYAYVYGNRHQYLRWMIETSGMRKNSNNG